MYSCLYTGVAYTETEKLAYTPCEIETNAISKEFRILPKLCSQGQ